MTLLPATFCREWGKGRWEAFISLSGLVLCLPAAVASRRKRKKALPHKLLGNAFLAKPV